MAHEMRAGCGAENAAAKPLLVIDPGVKEANLLLDGLDVDVDILLLAPGRSGLGQIADYLSGRRDIPALHILSHGEPGALVLAGSRIDLGALVLSHTATDTIAASLAVNASVVLYGCSVLAGPKGSAFARFLGVALSAEVSGSLMPVGSLALGGDWILRNVRGDWVDPIFTSQARATYPALLAPTGEKPGGGADAVERSGCGKIWNFERTGGDLPSGGSTFS